MQSNRYTGEDATREEIDTAIVADENRKGQSGLGSGSIGNALYHRVL